MTRVQKPRRPAPKASALRLPVRLFGVEVGAAFVDATMLDGAMAAVLPAKAARAAFLRALTAGIDLDQAAWEAAAAASLAEIRLPHQRDRRRVEMALTALEGSWGRAVVSDGEPWPALVLDFVRTAIQHVIQTGTGRQRLRLARVFRAGRGHPPLMLDGPGRAVELRGVVRAVLEDAMKQKAHATQWLDERDPDVGQMLSASGWKLKDLTSGKALQACLDDVVQKETGYKPSTLRKQR